MTELLVAEVRQSLITLHTKHRSCTSLFQQSARAVDPFAKVKPNPIPTKSIEAESDRGRRDRYPGKSIGTLLICVGRSQKGQITAEAELGKGHEEF